MHLPLFERDCSGVVVFIKPLSSENLYYGVYVVAVEDGRHRVARGLVLDCDNGLGLLFIFPECVSMNGLVEI